MFCFYFYSFGSGGLDTNLDYVCVSCFIVHPNTYYTFIHRDPVILNNLMASQFYFNSITFIYVTKYQMGNYRIVSRRHSIRKIKKMAIDNFASLKANLCIHFSKLSCKKALTHTKTHTILKKNTHTSVNSKTRMNRMEVRSISNKL